MLFCEGQAPPLGSRRLCAQQLKRKLSKPVANCSCARNPLVIVTSTGLRSFEALEKAASFRLALSGLVDIDRDGQLKIVWSPLW